ncbi:glycosyltransferase family 1 protein [Acinetobacter guillouiae]|uniref:glycosyltransferase family 1 protein n=1 Tax=Acinetobacter guillouiae TaxID=106649 RepID=UPI003AF86A1D
MNFLHTAMMRKGSSGILNQMYAEYISAQQLDLPYEVKIFTEDENISKKYLKILRMYRPISKNRILRWIEFRKSYYAWLSSQQNEVDAYILRHSLYDPFQFYFIKAIKKPVYLVHHTKELDELKILGLKGKLLSVIENIFGNQSIKISSGIVAVTNEIIEYEKKRIQNDQKLSILYSNGILIENTELVDKRNSNVIEMLFVASYFYDWHGLDLLIEAVQANTYDNFLIHIVGEVTQLNKNSIKNDSRFICHGPLNVKEISEISQSCTIALGSFALFRKNLYEGSTLKVREYLSFGLPVYSGHIDVFQKDFPFYAFGNLDIKNILSYAKKMMNYSKNEIRSSSEIYISKQILVKNFVNELESNIRVVK